MQGKDYIKDSSVEIEMVPGHKLADIQLLNRVMAVLMTKYPGYQWRAGVNDDRLGGVLYIMNLDINAAIYGNTPYGYVLKLTTVYADPALKCVMKAGGEILERARLARGQATGKEPIHIEGVKLHHQPIPGVTIDG